MLKKRVTSKMDGMVCRSQKPREERIEFQWLVVGNITELPRRALVFFVYCTACSVLCTERYLYGRVVIKWWDVNSLLKPPNQDVYCNQTTGRRNTPKLLREIFTLVLFV